jgi:phosphoribosylformylglycinamidine synthase
VKKPKALVLCGDGINCELESEFALKQAGFEPALMHTTQLLGQSQLLKEYQLLVIPGGFSFGDEIASGKVLAIKLKDHLRECLDQFIEAGSLVLGSCNGFQVLVQMGILPSAPANQPHKASLVHNSNQKFTNRWVGLDVSPGNPCLFLQGLKYIELPIRHGEGRLVVETSEKTSVKQKGCLRYREDVNGSFDRIAALTNDRGNVIGLMPHPEAFVRWTQHPAWTQKKGRRLYGSESDADPSHAPDGLAIFKNAAAVCRG